MANDKIKPDQDLNESDAELFAKATTAMQRMVDDTDAATLSRLNQARQKALEKMDKRSSVFTPGWLPAGAVALVAIFAVGLSFDVFRNDSASYNNADLGQEATVSAPEAELPDLEMMFAEESIDMMEEVEFFLWLEDEETTSQRFVTYDAVT